MLRSAVLGVAVLAGLGLGQKALAAVMFPADILVAGSDDIAVIDANNNGILNEDDDCVVHARTSDGSALTLTNRQSVNAVFRMKLCTDDSNPSSNEGHCTGSGMVSDFAEVILDQCEFAAGPGVPMFADFCGTLGSCTSHSMAAAGAGAAPATTPLQITAGAIFQTIFEPPFPAGSGQVCRAGGPAAQINLENGVTVLRALVPSQDGSHLCAHNVPVELAFGGGKVMRDVCFPVMNGVADFALSTDPANPFAIIDFTVLPACSGTRTGAPTMSEWALILLMLTLLAVGTWQLGHRRSFYASLPLP